MSDTTTLTLNDTTATVQIPTIKNTDSKVIMSLTMSSGSTIANTIHLMPIKGNCLVTSADLIKKQQHITFIKETLEAIDKAKTRDIKAPFAQMLFTYLAGPGLDFVEENERFKQAVIKKCYELKLCIPENEDLIKSIDNILTSLNMPLEKPSDLIINTSTVCNNSNCTIHDKPVGEAKEHTLNLSVFTLMAEQYAPDMKNISYHFAHCEAAMKRGSLVGSTIVEKMENYIECWINGPYSKMRTNLMKSLFTKNNLVFSDTVMPLYNKWKKTYKPTSKTNRYLSMCAFIDAYKSLFSAV